MINQKLLRKAHQALMPKIIKTLNSEEGFQNLSIELKKEIQVRVFHRYLNTGGGVFKKGLNENEEWDEILDIWPELNNTSSFRILLSNVLLEIINNPRIKFNQNDVINSLFWNLHQGEFERNLSQFLTNSSLADKKAAIFKFYSDNHLSIEEKTRIAILTYLNSKKRNIKNKVWVFLFDQLAVALYNEGKEAWQADFLTFLVIKRMQRETDAHWNLDNTLAIKLERIWGPDFEKVKRPFSNKFSNKNNYELDSSYNPFDHEPLNKPLKSIQRKIKSGEDLDTYLGYFLLMNARQYYDKPIYKNTRSMDDNNKPDNKLKSQTVFIDELSVNDNRSIELSNDFDPRELLKDYIPLFFKAFFELDPIDRLIILSVSDNEKMEKRPYIEVMRRFDSVFNSYTTRFSKLYEKDEENEEDIYAIRLTTKEKKNEKLKDFSPNEIREWYKENICRKGSKEPFYKKLNVIMNEFIKTPNTSKLR